MVMNDDDDDDSQHLYHLPNTFKGTKNKFCHRIY